MSKYISFGKYNKLYKYIWLYIISQLVYEYFYGSHFPKKITINYLNKFPKRILVQETFNYLGISIFSYFLFKYELNQLNQLNQNKRENSVSQESVSSSEVNLIYNEYKGNLKTISIQSFCFVIFLFIISSELINIFNNIGLKGLDFWMFEILFICLITVTKFKIPIYRHKQIAIFIILFFPIIMKIISLYKILKTNDEDNIYKNHHWIIPVGIISFLIFILIRDYSYCKIKWFFDLRYISAMKLLVVYGIMGTIICLIGSLISTNVECVDRTKFSDIKKICNITENDKNYYYDHFHIFFKKIWEEDIYYILFELFEIFISFLIKLFVMLIIKNLNPEFLICSKDIYFFIIKLLTFIRGYKIVDLYDLLSELFAIFGFFIYLELIECKFCKINYNLKKNIIRRSIKEIDDDNICDLSESNSQLNVEIEL